MEDKTSEESRKGKNLQYWFHHKSQLQSATTSDQQSLVVLFASETHSSTFKCSLTNATLGISYSWRPEEHSISN